MDHQGLLLCARYAFPPNSLKYCGPDKSANLFAYTKEQLADNGLREILAEFQTLYPYLTFIAHENNIRDPFDRRVVEAYWLGNKLLHNISMSGFSRHFTDALHLKKKITKKDFELLIGKLPAGAIPHHSFHVLNVFTRTGHHTISHTVETMDACRIGWGKVINKFSIFNNQFSINKKNGAIIKVLTKPLVLQNGKLTLGKPIIKEMMFPNLQHVTWSKLHDRWLSFHWNQFCDFLTPNQVANLEKYTKIAIDLVNKTL